VIRLADIMAKGEIEEHAGPEPVSPPLDAEHLRMLEAILFAASEPLDEASLGRSLPQGTDVSALLAELQEIYRSRGVNLTKVAEKWQFRTVIDLSLFQRGETPE
jgi:segregation and condensation protein B